MRANLVRIGNSRGIRIPKTLLEECRFAEVVDIRRVGSRLEIRSVQKARDGWSDLFRAMSEAGDDALLDRTRLSATGWDASEWRW